MQMPGLFVIQIQAVCTVNFMAMIFFHLLFFIKKNWHTRFLSHKFMCSRYGIFNQEQRHKKTSLEKRPRALHYFRERLLMTSQVFWPFLTYHLSCPTL